MTIRPSPAAVLFTLACLVAPLSLRAAITWDGSVSGSWNTAGNWDLNRVPNSTEELVFPSAASGKIMTNTFAAGTAFRQLTFQAEGYGLSGNSLTLATSGSAPRIRTTHSSGTVTLALPVTLQSTATLEVAAGGRLLLDGAADISMGSFTLNADVDGTLDITGTLSGTGGLNVLGSGRVNVSAVQSFSGMTSVTGRLHLTSVLAGSVTTFAGSTLTGSSIIGGTLTSSGGTVDPGDGSPGSTGILTAENAITFNTAGSKRLIFDVKSGTPGTGHDQLVSDGALTLRNAVIDLKPASPLPPGTVCVLAQGDEAAAATFSGLTQPDGSPLT